MVIVWQGRKYEKIRISRNEWILLIAGALIIVVAFVWDYSSFILSHFTVSELISLSGKDALFDLSLQYMPGHFPWMIFVLGELVILTAIGLLFRRYRRL